MGNGKKGGSAKAPPGWAGPRWAWAYKIRAWREWAGQAEGVWPRWEGSGKIGCVAWVGGVSSRQSQTRWGVTYVGGSGWAEQEQKRTGSDNVRGVV